LAWVYQQQGEYHRAMDPLLEARRIMEKSAGADKLRHALSTMQLAELKYNLNLHQDAIKIYHEAADEIERLYGRNHSYKAMILDHTGDVYRKMGDNARAKADYEEAVATYRRVFGGPHRATASPLLDLSDIYGNEGHLAEAVRCMDQAMEALLRE